MQYHPSNRLEASPSSSGTKPEDHTLISASKMNLHPEIPFCLMTAQCASAQSCLIGADPA